MTTNLHISEIDSQIHIAIDKSINHISELQFDAKETSLVRIQTSALLRIFPHSATVQPRIAEF